MCMQPRSTKELKQSPLHLKAVHPNPKSVSKSAESHSPNSPRREYGRTTGRKLDLNKDFLIKIENRIVSYLRRLKDFQTILKPGLDKLGLNDFVRILSHFLTFTGVRLKPFDKENKIEQTIVAMRQLQYPYKLNKSWMLVPSASIQNVLLLFDFLLDFAPQANESCDLNDEKLMNLHEIKQCEESNVQLKQELMDVESQLLAQVQTNDSISQQLRHELGTEAELQAQLKGKKEQLHALLEQTAQHEQNMGRLCLEIWRSKKQLKEFKHRLTQECCSYQAYGHILEESNNQLRLRCSQVQELVERTRQNLKITIEDFNVYVRHCYNHFGNKILTWVISPLAPTLSQIQSTQRQLNQLRHQISNS